MISPPTATSDSCPHGFFCAVFFLLALDPFVFSATVQTHFSLIGRRSVHVTNPKVSHRRGQYGNPASELGASRIGNITTPHNDNRQAKNVVARKWTNAVSFGSAGRRSKTIVEYVYEHEIYCSVCLYNEDWYRRR
jgi:hypothetical protein